MKRAYAVAAVWFVALAATGLAGDRKTENVVLIMTDGLRWQEVFTGAEEALMNKENGDVKDVYSLRNAYWRSTPEERREALMPFFWNVLAKQGQVYGNQHKGSVAQVTNGMNFSYPGYNEILCGFADPRIDTNDKRPNANVTVFEWLNKKPAFQGHVAAFGSWDVFPFIFNRQRCGFPINAAYEPLESMRDSPRVEMINRLKLETPGRWAGESFDSMTYHTAHEYLLAHKPRALYISLGETDSWGHEGKYDEYLTAARRADGYLKLLWETLQSIPQYQGKTSLIFAPDHGRGDAPVEWKSHGKKIARSEFIWIGVMGPDTPALGERANVPPVTQSQVPATLAALAGLDYCAEVPQAAKPIADAVGSSK